MGELFTFVAQLLHGWKRRAGVVTLMMTLAASGLSFNERILHVRYCHVGDLVGGERRADTFGWTNTGHARGLMWAVLRFRADPEFPTDGISLARWQFGENQFESTAIGKFARLRIQSDWENFGFRVVKGTVKGPRRIVTNSISILIVPDWSIILSLTLITSWLLLTKPRKSIQKQSTELASNEGR